MLLAAPRVASLEVANDWNGFIANFWRAVKVQPAEVARWADYPVSHIDLGARHTWLMEQRERLGDELRDACWPGDAQVAGWWLWGQCSWIGSGWCEWAAGQIPHVSDAGMGELLTSGGKSAWVLLHRLAARLERVRLTHGDWNRCLNNHYGGSDTAVFLDPPYRAFEALYRTKPVADEVAAWARERGDLRIALCGHRGDYELPGWEAVEWKRTRNTYASTKTTNEEAVWFSPACRQPADRRVERMQT